MVSPVPFKPVIEPLGNHHDRAAFRCGKEELDRYFRHQVGQDQRKKVSAPHVLVDSSSGRVLGYYTLSSCQIGLGDLPQDLVRRLRLPRYPYVPATLLGRLAVDAEYQKRGLGRLLLIDAMRRSLQATGEVASLALIVDTIDDVACVFYEGYGFTQFPDHPYRLFMLMTSIAQMLSEQV